MWILQGARRLGLGRSWNHRGSLEGCLELEILFSLELMDNRGLGYNEVCLILITYCEHGKRELLDSRWDQGV